MEKGAKGFVAGLALTWMLRSNHQNFVKLFLKSIINFLFIGPLVADGTYIYI